MPSLTAIKFCLRSDIPKKVNIEVKPCVYVVTSTGLKICKPINKKEFNDNDLLTFDREFSETLILSSSDITQGEFKGEIHEYSFPKDSKLVLKVYKIEEDGKEVLLYIIYVIKGDKIEKIYSERLPEINLSERYKRLRSIGKQLSVNPKDLLKLPAC